VSTPQVDGAVEGGRRSGSGGNFDLEKLKNSLRLTPIKAPGESVDQAIQRVSNLKRPEKPKAADIEFELESPKGTRKVADTSDVRNDMEGSETQRENISPTDSSASRGSAAVRAGRSNSSSQIPKTATRHRRSNAITLGGEEQKART
jgi:hypothetical protein